MRSARGRSLLQIQSVGEARRRPGAQSTVIRYHRRGRLIGRDLFFCAGFGLGRRLHELREALMVERGDRCDVFLAPIGGEIALFRHQAGQHARIDRPRIMRAVIGPLLARGQRRGDREVAELVIGCGNLADRGEISSTCSPGYRRGVFLGCRQVSERMPQRGCTRQSAGPRPRRMCESVVSSPAPGVAAESSLQPVCDRRTRRASIAALLYHAGPS